jgi:hypothetical protein
LRGGWVVIAVPAALPPEQIEAALQELGIDGGKAVLELAVEDFGMWCGVPPLDAN